MLQMLTDRPVGKCGSLREKLDKSDISRRSNKL